MVMGERFAPAGATDFCVMTKVSKSIFAAHNEIAFGVANATLCFAAFYFGCRLGAFVTGIDAATPLLSPILP